MLGMLSCVLAHHSLPDSFKPPKILSKPEIITSSKSFTYGSSPHNSDAPFQVRSYRGGLRRENTVYFGNINLFFTLLCPQRLLVRCPPNPEGPEILLFVFMEKTKHSALTVPHNAANVLDNLQQ